MGDLYHLVPVLFTVALAVGINIATAHSSSLTKRKSIAIGIILVLVGIAGSYYWSQRQEAIVNSIRAAEIEAKNTPTVESLPGYIQKSNMSSGWGPERETFTMERPAARPALNSITNAAVGDERNFVRSRKVGVAGATFGHMAEACPGDSVEVSVLVSNAASSSTGDAGTITGLLLRGFATNRIEKTGIKMLVESNNAGSVWSTTEIACAGRAVEVRFLKGSMTKAARRDKDREHLPGDPFARPIPFGQDANDGRLTSTKEWSMWITFQLDVI